MTAFVKKVVIQLCVQKWRREEVKKRIYTCEISCRIPLGIFRIKKMINYGLKYITQTLFAAVIHLRTWRNLY